MAASSPRPLGPSRRAVMMPVPALMPSIKTFARKVCAVAATPLREVTRVRTRALNILRKRKPSAAPKYLTLR
jgi:hypothetical protein